MEWIRIDVRDTAGSAAGGLGTAAPLPVPMAPVGGVLGDNAKPKRAWWPSVLRVARNAAIAVAVMTLVPIGYTMIESGRFANATQFDASHARVQTAERLRPWRLSSDGSITPTQAGEAFNAMLRNHKNVPGFPLKAPQARPEPMWRTTPVPDGLFPTARPQFYSGPSSTSILEAAKKGFSPAEMRYLTALASDPVWQDYELVARAPEVDFIGGQFQLPFGEGAMPYSRPIPSYAGIKEYAYAAVSRASYHLALGQKDSAEAVLRSIVSFGFAFIDNGSTMMDGLIGNVIVGIGRDGLQRLMVLTNDPRANNPELQPLGRLAQSAGGTRKVMSADESRARLIALLGDPLAPRGERYESLRLLSVSSCGNVRDLMFGPRDEVTDAIAKARASFARFPSERALFDLETGWAERYVAQVQGEPASRSVAVSAATVSGVVLRNPRLAMCTRLLRGF